MIVFFYTEYHDEVNNQKLKSHLYMSKKLFLALLIKRRKRREKIHYLVTPDVISLGVNHRIVRRALGARHNNKITRFILCFFFFFRIHVHSSLKKKNITRPCCNIKYFIGALRHARSHNP